MIRVRRAGALDASSMARLLNDIIAIGGTTAMTRPIAAGDLAGWMADEQDGAAWHVAVDEGEEVVGFQWVERSDNLPSDTADIATFVKHGQTGIGIGSKLFDATRAAAKAMGYDWISANIRADNEGGLIYYQSRNFEDYDRINGITLDNGQVVDKVLKRYRL
ncbi:MAG: N-acetyltransferase family protein [Paracoccaceae bacterium]